MLQDKVMIADVALAAYYLQSTLLKASCINSFNPHAVLQGRGYYYRQVIEAELGEPEDRVSCSEEQ